jgi:hypothetical protein
MSAGGAREDLDVGAIESDDLVAVPGKQNQGGVDDVGRPRFAHQFACCASEAIIQRPHLDSGECHREPSLARSLPPDLADHPTVRHRQLACVVQDLEANPHCTIVAVESDQGSRIEEHGHADFALRLACGDRVPRSRRHDRSAVVMRSLPA